jgi:hypothetical protein
MLRDILAAMIDKTTKILLTVIALGLWANVAVPFIKPVRAKAADVDDIERLVKSMESDLGRIQRGTCLNSKLC